MTVSVLQRRVRRGTSLLRAFPALKMSVAAVLAAAAIGARAQEFVVKDIRVEGIARTEAGTVFSYLPVRVGDRFDPDKGISAIRALYATGLFKDVRLEVEGDVLIVIVDERPAIALVDLNGVKEFEKDTVKKSLRDVGLGEARVFDRSLLDRAEQELKRQYLSRGKYAVVIKSTVTPVERNRVNIVINVDENESAQIQSIRFTGNKVFSDSTLRDTLELTTSGWWTWYTKRDQYSRQKLTGDLESLKSYYLNRGYLDFNVESTQVSIATSKESIYITINVSEGERYTLSEVKLAGELLGLDPELRALVDVNPGEVFNLERLNAVSKRITDRMSTLGYAFASANVVPEANRDKREVGVTFFVDPGRRVYVRRVNVFGNTRTRDDIVRREVRQFENAWYDAEKVRLSRDRIDRLGYFEKVEVETPSVPGSLDQLDVNFSIKERPTGTIQAGAGYSSTEKLVLNAAYSQQNVFGSGQAITLEVNTSKANQTIALSHLDPYVTQEGISRSVELFQRKSNLASLGLGSVDLKSEGGSIRFGVPFTEFDVVFLGLSYEGTYIGTTPFSPPRYLAYVALFGPDSRSLATTIGWARDSRDNLLVPTRGRYVRVIGEVAVPGFDLQYYRMTTQFQQFMPLTQRFTLAFNTEISAGHGYGGIPYPIFKNYYAGGLGSVRGFENGSLGPRDITGTPLGGNRKLVTSLELLAPLPGADRTLRALSFIDAAQVWAPGQSVALTDMRAAVGVGVAWISPMGPLKLSYAIPLRHELGDRLQRFQFQIGTGF